MQARAICRFFTLPALLIGLLAGCAGPVASHVKFHPTLYDHLELMAIHGDRDMRVELMGIPEEGRRTALAGVVGAAMSGHNWGRPITFTPTPSEEIAGEPTRISVLFNPAVETTGQGVCARVHPPPEEGAAQATPPYESVLLAYCRRQTALSSLRLDLPDGAVPGSRVFDESFAMAAQLLLPLRHPDEDRRRECRLPGRC